MHIKEKKAGDLSTTLRKSHNTANYGAFTLTLPTFIQQVGIPALSLNVLALLVGFALASTLQLNRAQSITIGYEVGIQNGTTALLVTSTILQNNMMSIAPTIYSLIMFVTGGLFGIALSVMLRPKLEEVVV